MAKMMTFADYKAQVFNDAREAIREAAARIDDWSRMYDELFVDDGVTGNASGSHTFSRAAADTGPGVGGTRDAVTRAPRYRVVT